MKMNSMVSKWRSVKIVEKRDNMNDLIEAALLEMKKLSNYSGDWARTDVVETQGIEGAMKARQSLIDIFGEDYFNEEEGDNFQVDVGDVERLKNWSKQEIIMSEKVGKATNYKLHQDDEMKDADENETCSCNSFVVGVGGMDDNDDKYSSLTALLLINTSIPPLVSNYHSSYISDVGPHQCCSVLLQDIHASVDTVWSFLRRFDSPQSYKPFVRSCDIISPLLPNVPVLRHVHVASGLPFASTTERLDILDHHIHVIAYSVVTGGDSDDNHRLGNYRSFTSLHPIQVQVEDQSITITRVVESYVVDTPAGNTKEETCTFLDTIVRCNLQSLSRLATTAYAAATTTT